MMWSTSSRFRLPISPLGYAPIRTPLFFCPFILAFLLNLFSTPIVHAAYLEKLDEALVLELMVQHPVHILRGDELVVFPAVSLREPRVLRIAPEVHLHPAHTVYVPTLGDTATGIHYQRPVHHLLHHLHDGVPQPFPRMIVFIIQLAYLPGIGLALDDPAMVFREIKLHYHPLHLTYRPFLVSFVHPVEVAYLPALLGLVAALGVLDSCFQVFLVIDLLEEVSNLFRHTLVSFLLIRSARGVRNCFRSPTLVPLAASTKGHLSA